jgi:Rrf2 family protein
MDVKVHISILSVEVAADMISQTAEYALRAIVYLADQDGARTTMQISKTTQVPAGYLAKVMQSLSRAGLVKSQRGLNGGFTLSHDPHELSILAVVNAVDPIQRFAECPLGIPSHGRRLCPLHHRLDQAAAMVENAFGETMVAELLAVPRERRPLCRFPMEPKAVS